MNRYIICLFFLFLSLTYGAPPEKLLFGMPPWQNPNILNKINQPLLQHLSAKLSIPVELIVTRDYDDLIEKVKNQKIHLAIFTSNTYVQAKEQIKGLQYIATQLRKNYNGDLKDHYQGVIATLAESPIQTLDDLKGKRIGFTDPHSSSGYIYPMLLLYQHGFTPKKDFARMTMHYKHNKIIEALMLKKIDAGATYDTMITETNLKLPGTLKIIAKTPKIPFDAVAASKIIDTMLVKKIQNILLQYKPKANQWDKVNLSKATPQGFAIRDDMFYDVVREANTMLENKK